MQCLKKLLLGLMVAVPILYFVATEVEKFPKPPKETQLPAMPRLRLRLTLLLHTVGNSSKILDAATESLKSVPRWALERQCGAFTDITDAAAPSDLVFFMGINLWRNGMAVDSRPKPAALELWITNCDQRELPAYVEALSQGQALVYLNVQGPDNQFILHKVLLLSESESIETPILKFILSSEKEAWEKLGIKTALAQ